jgi:uncharacterized protein YjbI with pentapeptide repeats
MKRTIQPGRPTWLPKLQFRQWAAAVRRRTSRSQWIRFTVQVAEYFGKLSIFGAAVVWLYQAPDREKERHYKAWEIINTAGGKVAGGRIAALRDLNDGGERLQKFIAKDAYLRGVVLLGADLEDANFDNARLDDGVFNCRPTGILTATWTSVKYRLGIIPDLPGTCTRLINASFRDASLVAANFDGAILNNVDFAPTDLKRPKGSLDGAVFRNAVLIRSKLPSLTLSQIDFSGATLMGVSFDDATFSGARFTGATLFAVNFARARLPEPDKLFETAHLCHVTLPDGHDVSRDCAQIEKMIETIQETNEAKRLMKGYFADYQSDANYGRE